MENLPVCQTNIPNSNKLLYLITVDWYMNWIHRITYRSPTYFNFWGSSGSGIGSNIFLEHQSVFGKFIHTESVIDELLSRRDPIIDKLFIKYAEEKFKPTYRPATCDDYPDSFYYVIKFVEIREEIVSYLKQHTEDDAVIYKKNLDCAKVLEDYFDRLDKNNINLDIIYKNKIRELLSLDLETYFRDQKGKA